MSELVRLSVAEREAVVSRLSSAFAHDVISLEEFERRCASAYRVASQAELAVLVADLPAPVPARSTPGGVPLVPLQERISAVFGNVERAGLMSVPPRLDIHSIFGNVELDLRAAHFGAGLTEISVTAVFGNIEMKLPAYVAVENHGSGMLASFTCKGANPDSPQCIVRLTGSAVLANVEIEVDRAVSS